MVTQSIELRGTKEVLRAFSVAGPELMRELRVEFQKDGQDFTGTLRGEIRARPRLRHRTGHLSRGIGHEVVERKYETPPSLTLHVFVAGVPYAVAQEFGATIRPTKARNLTIPLPDNITPGGRTRLTARQAFDSGGFLFVSKRGKKLIARESPPGSGNLEWLFVLVKKSVIPGPSTTRTKSRFGFTDTWERLGRRRDRRHEKAVDRVLSDFDRGQL